MHRLRGQQLPTFENDDQIYQADTCEPLIEAVDRGEVRLKAFVRGHYPGVALKRHELAQVKSVGFWDAKGDQKWGLDWHRNEGLELTFMAAGECAFGFEDQRYTLYPGDLTITRPWQPHCVGDPHIRACRLKWLILDLGVRHPNQMWKWPPWLVLSQANQRRLTEVLRHNEQPIWRTTTAIRQCWRRIARAVEAHGERESTTFESSMIILMNELFLELLRMFENQPITLDRRLSSSSRTVEMFLVDMAKHDDKLAHPWQVDEMAQACGLGHARFTALCRQLTNVTPMQYLTQCRIKRSKQLLIENRSCSVTQIAQFVGFSSSQYFASVFRRQVGVAPGEWRKLAGKQCK